MHPVWMMSTETGRPQYFVNWLFVLLVASSDVAARSCKSESPCSNILDIYLLVGLAKLCKFGKDIVLPTSIAKG